MSKKMESYSDQVNRLFGPTESVEKGVKTITIQVTEDCCLNCSYCYQNNKSKEIMNFDTAKRAIDDILERSDKVKDYIDSYDTAGVIIDFIGGEPFMAINLISEISDYFIDRLIELDHPWLNRFKFSICSNGVLYFQPEVQAYIKKHFNHLSFSISIDGNKKLHDTCRVFHDGKGSYDMAMAAVRHYVDVLGGDMGSKMTIAPENVIYTYEAVVSLIENGYTDINLNCVYEAGWTIEHAKILYAELKKIADYLIENNLVEDISLSIFDENYGHADIDDKNWCGGTGLMLALSPDGEYFPCLRYMKSSLAGKQDPYSIGNVDCGIGKSTNFQDRLKCLSCIKKSTQSTEKCLTCPIASGCGWCSAYNYEVYGTPNKRATFICQMHQARVLATSYLWNTWHKKINSTERYSLDIPEDWALEIINEKEFNFLKELVN
jgi:radical SAM peptide maturase (CXXX-repeat target family)